MNKPKPGQVKKVNQMNLKELKSKVEQLKMLNDDSTYLKHLEDAIGSYYLRG